MPVAVADLGNATRTTQGARWAGASGVILAPAFAGVLAFALLPPEWSFVCHIVALVLSVAFLGRALTGHWHGVLINERNLVSLSRTQMVLWTVVVLAAFGTYAVERVEGSATDPLGIGVPKELLIIMGLSTTSLVGSPLILTSKKTSAPSEKAVVTSAAQQGDTNPAEIHTHRAGLLYANPKPGDASLLDIFEGDEIGNTARIDLAKFQMAFLTGLLVFAYVFAIWQALRKPGNVPAGLPELSSGALALLGISHAGYLSGKTVDHTETAPDKGENGPASNNDP